MGDVSKRSDEVLAYQKDDRDVEQAVSAARNPTEKDNELVAVTTTASERLPFSKVRSIALVTAVSADEVGWSTPWVPTLIAVSLLIVVAFGFWQHYLETKTEKRPLMKMSIFKNRNFLWANVIMALFFSSFNNFLVYATYWFQDYQGLSVIQTTLRFIPTGVTGILVALVTGCILSSVRGDYILTFSTICVSVASLLFAIPIPDDTTYWAYGFPAMVLSVCGADTVFPVLTLFVAKALRSEDASLGGALIMAVGQIGRSFKVCLLDSSAVKVYAHCI